jgi:hypothetical protein
VVFEGGGDSQFDVRMTTTLFPEFQSAVNTISGGDKRRVADLYELLNDARRAGHLPAKFYSITDRDENSERPRNAAASSYQWDVYHIENYLLEPQFLLKVLQELNAGTAPLDTEEGVMSELVACAAQTIPSLVAHQLRSKVNRAIVGCVDLGFDPTRSDIACALGEAIERSRARIEQTLSAELTEAKLSTVEANLIAAANEALRSGGWRESFRGRDVLKRFVNIHGGGLRYEAFRDLILARMRDAGHRPSGMQTIVEAILSDRW